MAILALATTYVGAADAVQDTIVDPGPTDWTRFYGGVMLSGGQSDFDKNRCAENYESFCDQDKNSSGTSFGVGGQLGYDYDLGRFVVGGVVDGHWYPTGDSHTEYLASLRARFGALVTQNGLLYATGGVALGGFKDFKETGSNSGTTTTLNYDMSSTTGYVVGVGYEHKVSEKASLFGGLNYYKFDSAGDISPEMASSARPGSADAEVTQFTIGVNLGF